MINISYPRKIIVAGLKKYLDCTVIRGNQNAEIPAFPFVSYNITTLSSQNNGTYGIYADGISRKSTVQTWSITTHSNDYNEAAELASKAREWLDYTGTVYLNDNNVIVQSVGNVTDRSNLLTSDYVYSFGFDCFLWLYDEVTTPDDGVIEKAEITLAE